MQVLSGLAESDELALGVRLCRLVTEAAAAATVDPSEAGVVSAGLEEVGF
jgi:hypothetical protein